MAKSLLAFSDVMVGTHKSIPIGVGAQASAQIGDTDNRYEDILEFMGTVTVPAATVLGTGTLLTLLADAGPLSGAIPKRVPKGYKVCVEDIQVLFSGTAWTLGTDLRISDTSAGPVDFLTIAASAATAGVFYRAPFNGAIAGVTLGGALTSNSGGAVDKGLVIRATGTFTAGSAFTVWIRGYFVKV